MFGEPDRQSLTLVLPFGRRKANSTGKPKPSIVKVEGSGMMVINVGPLKPLLAKTEPTPSGVNFTIVLFALLAA